MVRKVISRMNAVSEETLLPGWGPSLRRILPSLPPFRIPEGSKGAALCFLRFGEFWQRWIPLLIRTGPELKPLVLRERQVSSVGAPGWRAMLVHRAPLLLWGAVLGSFVLGTLCDPPSHSLRYFYQLSKSTQWTEIFVTGYLDDQAIIHFNSLAGKLEARVPWMKDKGTFLAPEWVFRADLEKLSNFDAGGLHIWQVNLGCELREDGSKGGVLRYGYNGEDFISFDKETLRWVAAQPQAQKVKEKWEEDQRWSQVNKVYLENTCIEWLQRYLSYYKEAPQRIEPPVGKVSHKVVNDSLEVLICQVFGFYPKEIQAIWRRDGEVCQYETLQRNVAPNSDGTYFVQLSIEIDPKERNYFQCHLEHKGLREPLVLAWEEETDKGRWIPVGMTVAIILGAGILFLIYLWRRSRKNCHCKGSLDPDSPSPSPFHMYVIENEMPSQLMLQPEVSSEHNTTNGRRGPRMAPPEDTISRLLSRKGKQLLTYICYLVLLLLLLLLLLQLLLPLLLLLLILLRFMILIMIVIKIITIISIINFIVLVILTMILTMIISDISQGKEKLKQKQHYSV